MANPEHSAILKEGVSIWNDWRKNNPEIIPDLKGITLIGQNLGGFNLSKANLIDSDLRSAQFDDADFSSADLTGVRLTKTTVRNANFIGSFLKDAILILTQFEATRLNSAILVGANFEGSKFTNCDLSNADISNTRLSNLNIIAGDMKGIRLNKSQIINSIFTKINLNQAKFNGVYIDNSEFKNNDFKQADLSDAILHSTTFMDSIFSYSGFYKTKMYSVDMSNCLFQEVDLEESYLEYSNFDRAKLIEVNFRGSVMHHVSFINSDFIKSIFGNTIMGSVDLSKALNLDGIRHRAPSSIGIDTIISAKGNLPEGFLKGCGLNDLAIEMVTYTKPGLDSEQITDTNYRIHDLYFGSGAIFYSSFISYSGKDEEFARKIHDDLQDNGVRCWFAPEDMKIGDPIRRVIDTQIQLRDKLIIILSKNSIQSEWVGDEVEAAIEEEKINRRLILFPIRIDSAVMNSRIDWAAKIKRRRHIGDFTNWQEERSYRRSLNRLLRDLRTTQFPI